MVTEVQIVINDAVCTVHNTSPHPSSSPAFLTDGIAVVFWASGVREIVTALLRAILRQLFRHFWYILLHNGNRSHIFPFIIFMLREFIIIQVKLAKEPHMCLTIVTNL